MACTPFELSSRPPTVLVVDDLPINRLILRNMCSKLGFHVLEAADGIQCLREFAAHAPEVCAVLMDLKMPHLSGWEAAFQLRALENLHHHHHNVLEQTDTLPDSIMCDEDGDESIGITTPVMQGAVVGSLSQCTPGATTCGKLPSNTEQCSNRSSRRRIPIIACTATNPQESMSWFITSTGAPHMQPYTQTGTTSQMRPCACRAHGSATTARTHYSTHPCVRTAPATPLSSTPPSSTITHMLTPCNEPAGLEACARQQQDDASRIPHGTPYGCAADSTGVCQLDTFVLPDDLPSPMMATSRPPASTNVNVQSPADVSLLDDGPSTGSSRTDVWCTSTVAQAACFAGIDQVLVKPLRMSTLESTLDAWVPHWRACVKQRHAPAANAVLQ